MAVSEVGRRAPTESVINNQRLGGSVVQRVGFVVASHYQTSMERATFICRASTERQEQTLVRFRWCDGFRSATLWCLIRNAQSTGEAIQLIDDGPFRCQTSEFIDACRRGEMLDTWLCAARRRQLFAERVLHLSAGRPMAQWRASTRVVGRDSCAHSSLNSLLFYYYHHLHQSLICPKYFFSLSHTLSSQPSTCSFCRVNAPGRYGGLPCS